MLGTTASATVENHIDRTKRLGLSVTINETWY
jgi:hypothetical protein